MRKKITAFILVLALSLSFGLMTVSAAVIEDEVVQPMAYVGLSASLTKVSGTSSTYRAKATVSTSAIENLRGYVYLYNSEDTLLDSASGTKEGASLTVYFDRILSPGTYKLVAYGYGDTDSNSVTKSYTIS